MADYYFKMDDMAVGYQGKTLIHDINIGIDKGEIVTLIGPNGSGKSTILKSITKQLKLIGGKVFFDDTSIQEMSYKELSSNMAVVLTERIKTELMTAILTLLVMDKNREFFLQEQSVRSRRLLCWMSRHLF